MPKLLIALIVLIDVVICINYFWLNQGSVMSFAIWQGIIGLSAVTVIFNWKRLNEIKPN